MEMRKILTLDAVGVIMGKVKEFVAAQVAKVKDDIIGGAPATYDTLREIADYIESDGEAAAAMTEAIGKKAEAANVYTKAEADGKFAADIPVLDFKFAYDEFDGETLTFRYEDGGNWGDLAAAFNSRRHCAVILRLCDSAGKVVANNLPVAFTGDSSESGSSSLSARFLTEVSGVFYRVYIDVSGFDYSTGGYEDVWFYFTRLTPEEATAEEIATAAEAVFGTAS